MHKKLNTAAVAFAALSFFGTAQAAELKFQTTSTTGTFYDGGPGSAVDDTTASFGFDVSFTSPHDINVANGYFADRHPNTFGQMEINYGFGGLDEDFSSGEFNLINPDGSGLTIDFTPSTTNYPFFSGTYAFVGGVGETASGSFSGVVSGVPLPSSAPLFGVALVVLGGGSYARSRRSTASN